MNPITQQIQEIAADAPLPEGFVELPQELQPAAKSLIAWAATTRAHKQKRKQERQNRRKGRRHGQGS